MTNRDSQPYGSMEALRDAHEHLFDELPKLSLTDRKSADEQIEEFINRAISTGRILDTVNGRREAQGMIDYWVASAFTRPRNRGTAQAGAPTGSADPGASSTPDAMRDGRPDNQLESFDPEVIGSAAELGDKFIQSLPARKEDLSRQILLRLIDLPDAGENFSSAPASLDELRKFGDPAQVDELLDGLKTAGVLSIKPGEVEGRDDIVTLRYLALTRRWNWLGDEVKKRMSFRDLALSWLGSGRSNGALLNWPLTRGFRKYSNLNEWETEFVNKSGRYATKKLLLAIAVVLPLFVVAVVGASFNYYVYGSTPSKVESINREIKTSATPISRKIDDINWLARYRLPIDVSGVELISPEKKDLRGIFAPGAVFSDTKLTLVEFDGAFLGNASFSRSVIDKTSFERGTLVRARFDFAEFCEKVDFTDADVQYTSLKRVRFTDKNVPIFTRTAWWLTYGLVFSDIELFDKLYPRTGIADNDRFKREQSNIESRVEQAKDPRARAIALNEKAWTRAIYGVVSDGLAEKAITEGIELVESLRKTDAWANEHQSDFNDTLAYILMQKSEEDGAKKKENIERAAKLWATVAKPDDGEVSFRYAVALHVQKKESEANSFLNDALIEQQYEPSHELYLLRDYITGSFRQRIMDLTGRASKRLSPKRCPNEGNKPQ